MKRLACLPFSIFLALALLAGGCKTLESVVAVSADIGSASGFISQSHAESVKKVAKPLVGSFEELTPEQEHYLGRAVGAEILVDYEPLDLPAANNYLNMLGQALALGSDRPQTFGGYRFLLLDSPEINAFAAPGGLIFVTYGMLDCCLTEEALAAVLAHEIAHVQLQHGLRAIQAARLTSAMTILATEGAKTFGGDALAELTNAFEESIGDIVSTLVVNGYSSSQEKDADRLAVTILERVGYDPKALVQMLEVMGTLVRPGDRDFGSTHPAPHTRIDALRGIVTSGPVATVPIRQTRYNRAFQEI